MHDEMEPKDQPHVKKQRVRKEKRIKVFCTSSQFSSLWKKLGCPVVDIVIVKKEGDTEI